MLTRNALTNDLTYEVYQGSSTGGKVTASSAIELNKWQYFAITQFTNGSAKIYKNGVYLTSGSTYVPNNVTRTNNYIGRSNFPDDYYNGSIDEVKVYNRVLSDEQIWYNYIESNQSKNPIKIVSNETTLNEEWLCSVTPNDGSQDGTTTNSTAVTISGASDNPPSVTNVQATPQKAANSSIVNISATITDDYGISQALANIYYPNATFWKNITLENSGDVWFNDTFTLLDTGPWGRYNFTIWAIDTNSAVNDSEKGYFISYLKLNGMKTNITIDGSFTDWDSPSVRVDDDEIDDVTNANDFNVRNFSVANNATYLYLRIGINGTVNYSNTNRMYRAFISVDDSTGSINPPNSDDTLPFKYDYRIELLNESYCKIYNSAPSLVDNCTISNNTNQIEISILLTSLGLSSNNNINISFETAIDNGTASDEDTSNWNLTFDDGSEEDNRIEAIAIDDDNNVFVVGQGVLNIPWWMDDRLAL